MIGTIELENVRLNCIIGELEHERTNEQLLLLDITYTYDIKKTVRHDDIDLSVDYSKLSEMLIQFISNSQFKLLETLCVECCSLSLDQFPKIESISIKAKKPDALHNIDLCSARFTLDRVS
ncbi:MAG: dihydroneopterin aldolase [Fibrobacterales bacterium]